MGLKFHKMYINQTTSIKHFGPDICEHSYDLNGKSLRKALKALFNGQLNGSTDG